MSLIKAHRSLRWSESSHGQNEDHGEMRDVQVEGEPRVFCVLDQMLDMWVSESRSQLH